MQSMLGVIYTIFIHFTIIIIIIIIIIMIIIIECN